MQSSSAPDWRATVRHPVFRCGAREMAGPSLGIAAWGLVTGVAMVKGGLGVPLSLLMTFTVFAGSAQLATVPLIASGAPVWVIWATAFCVNLRFVIFSAQWRPYFMRYRLPTRLTLGYFAGDPSHPVVLGSLYSSGRTPPYALAAPNDTKAFVTRCGHKLEFDEKDQVITVATPANNRIVLSDKDKSIRLEDQNGNTVELKPGGIALDSPKDITVTAQGRIALDAVGAVSISSQADVQATGLNVNCEARIGFTAKGNAAAELSASGQTVVKGAMVMIN